MQPSALSFKLAIVKFGFMLTMLMTIVGCAGLGKKPSEKLKTAYASSPNFDSARGIFLNLAEPELDSFWEANKERFREGVNVKVDGAPPDFKLPMVKPDLAAFNAGDSGLRVIWIGHSTLLIKMDSTVILTDAVFGRASPISFYKSPRFQQPVIEREKLPDVDFIVISHEHYDHLEASTVQHFAKKNTKFLVPLGISSHLRYWGVKDENIIERDWWKSDTINGIEFTATPSWHSSGRTGRGTNFTQWSSWVIRNKNHNIYFSGDTGYGRHFRMIGDLYGPFDVVFLENGQYSRAWRSHMQPEHWPKVMRDLKSENWFPIHWGVFSFAPHKWDDPIRAADTLARNHGLKLFTPKMGELVDLENPQEFTKWWERPSKGE